MLKTKWIWYVLVAGILVRVLAALTVLRPLHPDELHQTVEFAHYFLFGFTKNAQEVAGHFRNLSWPAMLVAPYKLGDLIFSGDPHGRLFVVRLTVAAANLGILWGMMRSLRLIGFGSNVSSQLPYAFAAFYLGAWFFIEEAGRTSIEHGAAICLWLGLGLLTTRRPLNYGIAGFLFVWTGVIKYPAGLLGVGALAALLITELRAKQPGYRIHLVAVSVGTVVGLLAGGIADFVVYGRPYESLWMYVQYNVLTNSAEAAFGAQSATVYFTYFYDRLGKELLPLLMIVTVFFPIGFFRGLKNFEPWAYAALFYFAGHLIPAHKEPRFMAPLLHLVVFGSIYGLWLQRVWILNAWNRFRFVRRAGLLLFVLLIGVNLAKLLEVVRGELWKPRIDFFVADTLARRDSYCALVTVADPYAFQLPIREYRDLGSLPLAVLAKGRSWQPLAKGHLGVDLRWLTPNVAACRLGEFLLHVHQSHPNWGLMGCRELARDGGLYSTLGRQVNRLDATGSPFYACPMASLQNFGSPPFDESAFATGFPRLKELPPLGVTADQLKGYVSPGNFRP